MTAYAVAVVICIYLEFALPSFLGIFLVCAKNHSPQLICMCFLFYLFANATPYS